MANLNLKLEIGEKFLVNTKEYYGLKKGEYEVVGFTENRLGAKMYEVKSLKKNTNTTHLVYVEDLDKDLFIPTIDDLTNPVRMIFNNSKEVVKYDENLFSLAKEINSNK